jgi:hypothetical protein
MMYALDPVRRSAHKTTAARATLGACLYFDGDPLPKEKKSACSTSERRAMFFEKPSSFHVISSALASALSPAYPAPRARLGIECSDLRDRARDCVYRPPTPREVGRARRLLSRVPLSSREQTCFHDPFCLHSHENAYIHSLPRFSTLNPSPEPCSKPIPAIPQTTNSYPTPRS